MIANNPAWGASFAAALQSGNSVAVQRTLGDLSTFADTALSSTYGHGVVLQAIYRFVSIASGPSFEDILRGRGIPFNLQRPCCLEPILDPLVSSVLAAFLQNIWSSTAGGQPPVARAIAELMIARVTTGMWAA
jgi:hypothetical protein